MTTLKIIFILLFLPAALAAQIYVSPAGADTNTGTFNAPFLTIGKALSVAGPDSLIYLRGGTYLPDGAIQPTDSGLTGKLIKIWAYPDESPVIDFSQEVSATDGIKVKGSYYHLKGLEVKNAAHNGIYITGSNNIIEQCRIHNCGNTGLHMRYGASNNLILNCDSYFNFDPPVGGNADGFSAKWEVGPGNIFRGCRSYNNSDDGWDLWMGINPVVIESCWAFRNGVDIWHTGKVSGNGNGFKLGGNGIPASHIVRFCVAFDNAGNTGHGFDQNNNPAGQTLFNCTAFRNKYGGNYFLASNVDTVPYSRHTLKNCLSHRGSAYLLHSEQEANSWQGFSVSDADFASLDTALALAPRRPDGRLPSTALFRLAAGSSLINAGVNVGFPYAGSAPDLGTFEFGLSENVAAAPSGIPPAFSLGQNYPNPFNPTTDVGFRISDVGYATLKIFDVLGREVATLVNELKAPGEYHIQWDATGMPSGVYYYRLATITNANPAKQITQTRRMLLVK